LYPEDLLESARRIPDDPAVAAARLEQHFSAEPYRAPRQRLWIHVLLFAMTLFTTTLVGAHMQYNFAHNLPFFDIERLAEMFSIGLRSPMLFMSGLPFSLTLLTILMAHEMGHYLACVYHGVDATLPFFLPSPMPVTGTFGAFIRIRSAIYNKKVLFDIGVAGPLAGFVFLIPALGTGLAFSKIVPGINHQGTLQLGVPLLQWMAQKLIFPGVNMDDIYLHPIARAAWVGMFATALNLLPAGQLDGGHVVYALLGKAHKWITYIFLGLLLPMGRFWSGWWFWAAVLFLFARRHPPLYDTSAIGGARVQLGFVALGIFLLCFSLIPLIE
jgi:membrane-associated protease RseP (regulator of RpoE activity)